jgi:hypothetical protein
MCGRFTQRYTLGQDDDPGLLEPPAESTDANT